MFTLPRSTEVSKQLPKKSIYTKFMLNNAAQSRFDTDISKIVIVNELSPLTTNMAYGQDEKSIYVLLVTLKNSDFDERNISLLSRLINQNMLFVLEYDGASRLAVYHKKLIISADRKSTADIVIELKGLDLDAVWENIIRSIEGGEFHSELSLDENLLRHEQQEKIRKQIAALENRIAKEKQLNKQMQLNTELKRLKKSLEEM